MKNTNNVQHSYNNIQTLFNLFAFGFSSIYFYGAIKILFTLIGSMFNWLVPLLTISIIYALPLVYFIFHFKNCFLKPCKKVSKIIFVSITTVLEIFVLVGLIMYFPTYLSNSNNGVYESLSMAGIAYPVDAIILLIVLLGLNVYLLYFTFKPESSKKYIEEAFHMHGHFEFKSYEFALLIVLTLFASFYLGDFLNSFYAIGNAGINGKYVFLMLITLIPLINLVYFITKPIKGNLKKSTKITLYSVITGINLLFLVLFITFLITDPNFVPEVGRPIFPIDFVASMQIGPITLYGILGVSLVFDVYYLIKLILLEK